jgi:hypothetical protein
MIMDASLAIGFAHDGIDDESKLLIARDFLTWFYKKKSL